MRASARAAIQPTKRTSPPAEDGLDGWVTILDLSEDPFAVSLYCLLRDTWWTHVLHSLHGDAIHVDRSKSLWVFTCSCHEQLGFPVEMLEAVACGGGPTS